MSALVPDFSYLIRYALYSGVAVLFELITFTFFFRWLTLSPFWANAFSAVTGLALAWFISGHRIFAKKKITPFGHIIWYGYQFLAIYIYSFLVADLIKGGIHYVLSKMIVLVLSFTINSLFFRFVVLRT